MDKLKKEFSIIKTISDIPDDPMSIHQYNIREFEVKADSLYAFLSPLRAILFQKVKKPFTSKDLKLRERIFDFYPRTRPTPLPWLVGDEPKFEYEDKKR